METLTFFDIPIHNLHMKEAVSTVEKWITTSALHKKIYYLNTHCFNIAARDPSYKSILSEADLLLPDGLGVNIASKILGHPIKDNVNGTDMFPHLCHLFSLTQHRVFLLGGTQKTLDALCQNLKNSFPDLIVSGTHHGYFSDLDTPSIIEAINQSKATCLFVALGVPKQEKWISKYLGQTHVSVAFAVGGLFDFYSGNISRAPLWMRQRGLEWCYRLYQEPYRMWRRYLLGNPLFILRSLRLCFVRWFRNAFKHYNGF